MHINDAYSCVINNVSFDVGSFYAPGTTLSLGKGTIYDNALYPYFEEDQKTFLTLAGLVYVLTHECDVDAHNERLFNTDLLICPIIPLEHLVAEHAEVLSDNELRAFLGNLGARRIFRLLYLPPYPPALPYGGVMYLNQITNTSTTVFRNNEVQFLGAVTGPGLEIIERLLENHLLRPKAERLAYVPDGISQE